MWVVLGWAIATASNLAVLYGLSHVAQGHPASAGVAAFYNAVSRTVWGVGLAWVVFACVTGHAGALNSGVMPSSHYAIFVVKTSVVRLNDERRKSFDRSHYTTARDSLAHTTRQQFFVGDIRVTAILVD